MGKKIAFFDIDGTLLNVPKGLMAPTQKTRDALIQFQKQGHYIVVATARGVLPESLNDIPFDGMICCDGHYIEFHNEVLVNHIFSPEDIQLQQDIYNQYDSGYLFGGHFGEWMSDPQNELVKKHQRLYLGSDQVPDDYDTHWQKDTIKSQFATAIFASAKDMYEAKKQLPTGWQVNAYDENHIRMDVHLPGFSKGTACRYLYEKLKINKEDTYAFGDGYNDIEMLALVGHGVAMANGVEELKKNAKEITASVDEDGIAQYFKKLK